MDPRFVENFSLAFAQLIDAELPEDLLIEQLPTVLARGPRRFRLSYEPIRAHGKLAGPRAAESARQRLKHHQWPLRRI